MKHIVLISLFLIPDHLMAEGQTIHLKNWTRRAKRQAARVKPVNQEAEPIKRKHGGFQIELGATGKQFIVRQINEEKRGD